MRNLFKVLGLNSEISYEFCSLFPNRSICIIEEKNFKIHTLLGKVSTSGRFSRFGVASALLFILTRCRWPSLRGKGL